MCVYVFGVIFCFGVNFIVFLFFFINWCRCLLCYVRGGLDKIVWVFVGWIFRWFLCLGVLYRCSGVFRLLFGCWIWWLCVFYCVVVSIFFWLIVYGVYFVINIYCLVVCFYFVVVYGGFFLYYLWLGMFFFGFYIVDVCWY